MPQRDGQQRLGLTAYKGFDPGLRAALADFAEARLVFAALTIEQNNRRALAQAQHPHSVLERNRAELDLHTDSKYVMDGISKWIFGWKKNGWKTADKKPVKNGELWQQLDAANQRHKVKWHWVKGHAGHPENERADELARLGMEPFKRK